MWAFETRLFFQVYTHPRDFIKAQRQNTQKPVLEGLVTVWLAVGLLTLALMQPIRDREITTVSKKQQNLFKSRKNRSLCEKMTKELDAHMPTATGLV